jgi:predicted trehalose synthase
MASSFECAALQLLFDPAVVRERDFEIARPWALQWASWAAAAFTHAYLTATAAAPFLVADREALSVHFDALIIERALHRLHVELEDPSPSVMIPMLSLARALDK